MLLQVSVGTVDPEVAMIVRALAHAAVSRDRAARKIASRVAAREGASTQSRNDGDPDAHSDLRKV